MRSSGVDAYQSAISSLGARSKKRDDDEAVVEEEAPAEEERRSQRISNQRTPRREDNEVNKHQISINSFVDKARRRDSDELEEAFTEEEENIPQVRTVRRTSGEAPSKFSERAYFEARVLHYSRRQTTTARRANCHTTTARFRCTSGRLRVIFRFVRCLQKRPINTHLFTQERNQRIQLVNRALAVTCSSAVVRYILLCHNRYYLMHLLEWYIVYYCESVK